MTVPPHNPDGEPSFQDWFDLEFTKGYLQKLDGPNAVITDEDAKDFLHRVRNDGKPLWANGGIIQHGRLYEIGEHTDCHLPPLGIDSPLSKMLTDATSLEIHWPEALKARRDQAITTGGLDSDSITYWPDATIPPEPAVTLALDGLRAFFQRYNAVWDRPRAYRMHPDTIDALPRHEQPGWRPYMGQVFGIPIYGDDSLAPGEYKIVRDNEDQYGLRGAHPDPPNDHRYHHNIRYAEVDGMPMLAMCTCTIGHDHPADATEINADGRTPSNPDSAKEQPPTDGRDDLDGWNKPEPSHWCAGWALLLGLGVLGAIVILVAAGLITLAAMLGVFG